MSNSGRAVRDAYHDGSYLASHPGWHGERASWKARQVLEGLSATGVRPRTVCDVGCGTGLALAEVIRGLGGVDHAVGFEPSTDAPTDPRLLGLAKVRREDATNTTETFDVSLMLDVFEHVEDDTRFLRACSGLAPHHVFHIPLDASALAVIVHGMVRTRRALGHLHYYTAATALATLVDAGYEPLHWHFTPAAWDGDDRDPWRPVNILRRLLFRISPEGASRLLGGVSLLVVARATQDGS